MMVYCGISSIHGRLNGRGTMGANTEPDVLIVGAGPGGLTAAMMLAKAGVKVTILEKSDDVGGRTRVIEKDGYKFDNGPTFFHYPEIAEEIFSALGMDAYDELNLIPIEPNYRLVFGSGGSLNATANHNWLACHVPHRARGSTADESLVWITEPTGSCCTSWGAGIPSSSPGRRSWKLPSRPRARPASSATGNEDPKRSPPASWPTDGNCSSSAVFSARA